MLAYACTIFLSAFLLFAVQPMIGKIILPWFGGSAAVWSTCLLFFQAALLGGYLYAHWSTRRLNARRQTIVHIILMGVSLALLPVLPSPTWRPTHAGDPSGRILLLLAATIGLPYILLSTTSPLLQAWYVAGKPGAIPYRLFALSNFGSLLALISYPALWEPRLTTRVQAYTWSGAYAAFVLLCAAVAWGAFRVAEPKEAEARPTATEPETIRPAPLWTTWILWAALSACATSLLLSITNHLSQNVAPIPFLWVLPLGMYLLSFILCFERERIYHRAVFLPLGAIALGGVGYVVYSIDNPNISWAIPLYVAALFICCMVCHGELVRLKPDPRHLTSFYLMISVGGALGGLFVAIIAPNLFHTYLELLISLVACPALVSLILWVAPGKWNNWVALHIVRTLAIAFTTGLAVYMVHEKRIDDADYRLSVRNFYGVLRIKDVKPPDETYSRKLIHGTILHGVQLLDARLRDTHTSYYGENSGVGRALTYFAKKGPKRVGVIGLGAGVTVSYCVPGDYFQVYEINPLALSVASTWFTFLKDCPNDKVLLGDARLTLESQPDQHLDMLTVDAFTSDSIPVHLLTREAFALYFRHLQPSGILAVHISNRYLDLEPVVARNSADLGKTAMEVDWNEEETDYMATNDWILVSGDPAVFKDPLFHSTAIKPAKVRPGLRPWTDDYSNLFQILKLKFTRE